MEWEGTKATVKRLLKAGRDVDGIPEVRVRWKRSRQAARPAAIKSKDPLSEENREGEIQPSLRVSKIDDRKRFAASSPSLWIYYMWF